MEVHLPLNIKQKTRGLIVQKTEYQAFFVFQTKFVLLDFN